MDHELICLLARCNLEPPEKVVWIAIKSLEVKGSNGEFLGCVTPLEGIAKRAGYKTTRHVQRIIKVLVERDYCQKIIHSGGPNALIVKFPDTPDTQTTPGPHVTPDTQAMSHRPPLTHRPRSTCHTKTLRTNTEKKEEKSTRPPVEHPHEKSDNSKIYDLFIEKRRAKIEVPDWLPSDTQAKAMRAMINKLLKKFSLDDLLLWLQNYFDDPAIAKRGYPWGLWAVDPVSWKQVQTKQEARTSRYVES